MGIFRGECSNLSIPDYSKCFIDSKMAFAIEGSLLSLLSC